MEKKSFISEQDFKSLIQKAKDGLRVMSPDWRKNARLCIVDDIANGITPDNHDSSKTVAFLNATIEGQHYRETGSLFNSKLFCELLEDCVRSNIIKTEEIEVFCTKIRDSLPEDLREDYYKDLFIEMSETTRALNGGFMHGTLFLDNSGEGNPVQLYETAINIRKAGR